MLIQFWPVATTQLTPFACETTMVKLPVFAEDQTSIACCWFCRPPPVSASPYFVLSVLTRTSRWKRRGGLGVARGQQHGEHSHCGRSCRHLQVLPERGRPGTGVTARQKFTGVECDPGKRRFLPCAASSLRRGRRISACIAKEVLRTNVGIDGFFRQIPAGP
jgi:hypothetical protein